MTNEKSCVYRVHIHDEEPNPNASFQKPENGELFECQILRGKGAKDTTCYNTDQSEKTCTTSPASQS